MPFSRLPALLKKIMILITIERFSMGVNTLMSKAFLAPALMVLLAMLVHGREQTTTLNGESLYSSRHYDTDQALYDNFTESTGVKVNLIEAGATS